MGASALTLRVQDDDFSLAIVIITPLMSRVHKHAKHSGELVFMAAPQM